MTFIPIKTENGLETNDLKISQTTFKDLNLKETHIEEFIRKNIDIIFDDEETLLMIGQQIQNQSKGISDLIAIDENGNLVLIEIKRDIHDMVARKEAFEFQAIRYAASLAKISSPEDLVDKVFIKYLI